MSWIFDASPTTDEERADLTRALGFRDELHRLNNQLVLQRLQVAALGLAGKADGLEALTGRLRAETRTIDSVKHVVEIADQVVTIAASIVAMLA